MTRALALGVDSMPGMMYREGAISRGGRRRPLPDSVSRRLKGLGCRNGAVIRRRYP
jgi:hypothetical protein